MNCDGCVFFESTDYGSDDAGVELAFGECHRYPPTPIPGSPDRSLRLAKFPRVADDTWCGEFQSRRGLARTELPHERTTEANAAFDAASQQNASVGQLCPHNASASMALGCCQCLRYSQPSGANIGPWEKPRY